MMSKFAFVLAAASVLGGTMALGTHTAVAQTIGVHISNEESEDIFVTLMDLNSGSSRPVLDNTRINRGSRKTIDIAKDGNGRGRVSWTAKIDSEDARKVKCGKGTKSGIDVGSEIDITARSSC